MRLRWPNQVTSYRSALPGVGAPGLDISKPELPTKYYFINSLADTSTGAVDARGPNCWAGTFRYCWGADQGAGFHKVMIPLISGYAYQGRRVTGPGRGDVDYIGHAAPDAGFFVRCCGLRFGGGTNVRAWHLPSWCGDEASAPGVANFLADTRDCLGASQSGVASSNTAFINCEARFGMDEAAEIAYYEMDGASWIRGAVYDPLHAPPGFGMPPGSHHEEGVDHGYGSLAGGTRNVASPGIPTAWTDRICVMQSLFAHTTDRNPLLSVLNAAHINNLHYNHGRPNPGGRGAGWKLNDNQAVMADSGKTMHANVIGNMTVRGPEQAGTETQAPVLAEAVGTFPLGCTAHVALNAQFGWPAVTSQDIFMRDFPYPEFLQPTMRLSALYEGFGDQYQGVLRAFRDPLNPTVQEGLEFVQLLRETTGVMPRRRYKLTGGLARVYDQIETAIRGAPFVPTWQYINAVADLGGWDVLPTSTTIDPLAPTRDYHAPLPCDASRDTILTSGTFSNGMSKRGYTKWRAWCIEQYFYVMGP